MSKTAVIDIGSNTSKLLVARLLPDQTIESVFQESIPCRISGPLANSEDCLLSKTEINQIAETVRRLLETASRYQNDKILMVGTEALRKARNVEDLQKKLLDLVGVRLVVLTGRQEAKGIACGILTDPCLQSLRRFHAFDLGGGSLELIAFSNHRIPFSESFPLGSVKLKNQFVTNPWNAAKAEEIKRLRDHVNLQLEAKRKEIGDCEKLIGAGGSIVHLRKTLEAELTEEDSPVGKIFTLPKVFLENLEEKVSSLDLPGRRKAFPLIPEERLDILPTALNTLLEVMTFMKVDCLSHSFHSLRFGIAAEPRILEMPQ